MTFGNNRISRFHRKYLGWSPGGTQWRNWIDIPWLVKDWLSVPFFSHETPYFWLKKRCAISETNIGTDVKHQSLHGEGYSKHPCQLDAFHHLSLASNILIPLCSRGPSCMTCVYIRSVKLGCIHSLYLTLRRRVSRESCWSCHSMVSLALPGSLSVLPDFYRWFDCLSALIRGAWGSDSLQVLVFSQWNILRSNVICSMWTTMRGASSYYWDLIWWDSLRSDVWGVPRSVHGAQSSLYRGFWPFVIMGRLTASHVMKGDFGGSSPDCELPERWRSC